MRGAIISIAFLTMTSVAVQAGEGSIINPDLEQTLMREFSVSAEEIDRVVDTGVPYEDIIVSFHVAQRANMSPVRVATIRKQGGTWPEIADFRGLTPRSFYVLVSGEIPSARYAAIIDKFSFSVPPSNDWGKVPLTDEDVIDLVHLKFVASAYDYNIFEAMALRDQGMEFSQICTEISERKHALLEKQRLQGTTAMAAANPSSTQ